MNLNTHIELFMHEGILRELPVANMNGRITIGNLGIEVFANHSMMPNESLNEGDTVFFFIIPTKYIHSEHINFASFTAINISRYRRRIHVEGTVFFRPCCFGTTIQPTYDTTQERFSNFLLNEYFELSLASTVDKIQPFEMFENQETSQMARCPNNTAIDMPCSDEMRKTNLIWN